MIAALPIACAWLILAYFTHRFLCYLECKNGIEPGSVGYRYVLIVTWPLFWVGAMGVSWAIGMGTFFRMIWKDVRNQHATCSVTQAIRCVIGQAIRDLENGSDAEVPANLICASVRCALSTWVKDERPGPFDLSDVAYFVVGFEPHKIDWTEEAEQPTPGVCVGGAGIVLATVTAGPFCDRDAAQRFLHTEMTGPMATGTVIGPVRKADAVREFPGTAFGGETTPNEKEAS